MAMPISTQCMMMKELQYQFVSASISKMGLTKCQTLCEVLNKLFTLKQLKIIVMGTPGYGCQFPKEENRETEVSGFRFFSSGWCFCEKIIGETFGFLDYFLISGGQY